MKQKNRKMTPKKDASKTMDVSKPGKTDPDISSRPVLVTNHSMVQDPTLKEDNKPTLKPMVASAARVDKIISPVGEITQETTKVAAENPISKETGEKTDTEKKQAQEAAVVDAVADQATEDKKKQNKLSDEELARKKEIEQLITDKKYFVPIGQVSKRRNRRMLIVFLVILVLVIIGYLAIDAGIIKSSVTLPFDIIKN